MAETIRSQLDKDATVAKAAQACADANAGNIKKAVEIALDIDQSFYEVTTLVNAANLINRIQDICRPNAQQRTDDNQIRFVFVGALASNKISVIFSRPIISV